MSESTPASPKSKSKNLVIIALTVVLVGGAGAFWYMRAGAGPAAAPAHAAVERGAVAFDPFVVNLADANASRFLRVTVHLLLEDAAIAAHFKENLVGVMQVRSAILELLTLQTSDRLATPDGKATLKKEIVDRISMVMEELKVVDVLFSDFVIQF